MVDPVTHASASGKVPDFIVALGLALPVREEEVHVAFRARVKHVHPDVGGDPNAFKALETAYERALAYARFRAGRAKWLGAAVERYAEHQELLDQIRRWGGTVELKSIDWMKQSIGEDFAQVLDEISQIRLQGPAVNDAMLEVLAAKHHLLSALHVLDLTGSRISDDGLRLLVALPSLRTVVLRRTQVTNKGLQVLVELPNLEQVLVRGTRASWWGLFKLRKTLPEVKIAK